MEKTWEESHYLTQKKGDNVAPSGCPMCGDKNLKKESWGWACQSCDAGISGLTFYQGRNSKEVQFQNVIKVIEEFLELKNVDMKGNIAVLIETLLGIDAKFRKLGYGVKTWKIGEESTK